MQSLREIESEIVETIHKSSANLNMLSSEIIYHFYGYYGMIHLFGTIPPAQLGFHLSTLRIMQRPDVWYDKWNREIWSPTFANQLNIASFDRDFHCLGFIKESFLVYFVGVYLDEFFSKYDISRRDVLMKDFGKLSLLLDYTSKSSLTVHAELWRLIKTKNWARERPRKMH